MLSEESDTGIRLELACGRVLRVVLVVAVLLVVDILCMVIIAVAVGFVEMVTEFSGTVVAVAVDDESNASVGRWSNVDAR